MGKCGDICSSLIVAKGGPFKQKIKKKELNNISFCLFYLPPIDSHNPFSVLNYQIPILPSIESKIISFLNPFVCVRILHKLEFLP